MKNVKKILAFLLCIFTLLSVLSSCNFEEEISDPSGDETYDLSDGEISESSSNETSIAEPRVISFGLGIFDEEGEVEEITTHRMASRTYSYFKNEDKIVVELFMGDWYSYFQKNGGIPSYDTYGTNGYPLMRIYEVEGVGFEVNENSLLTFNGTNPLYEKKFSTEDMKDLDYVVDGVFRRPLEWHTETVEIDFSELKTGDSGEICLGFGWFYYESPDRKDPSNPDEPAKDFFDCHNNYLSYYVGENGIGLSYLSWETARKEAELIEGKTFPVEE